MAIEGNRPSRSSRSTIREKAMASVSQTALRSIPKVDRVLEDSELVSETTDVPKRVVVEAVRWAVEQTRSRLLDGSTEDVDAESLRKDVISDALARIRFAMGPYYRKVINATGIILHTALGRAVLSRKALDQIGDHMAGYSLLQADLEVGKRSKRDGRIEWLLQQITGCEAATVVNNNAAATMITLNTVARGREVIVSRGQLVEIGGSFRLPEVMEASGVKLVEVGTTNKTHARDYENAITENTAAIMRLHPSNYRIVGFTSEVPLDVIVDIAHRHELVMIDDLGAGALVDFGQLGFEPEPTLQDSVRAGADVITCSADKLIGAHQGGIILGKTRYVEAIRKNPLARVVRVGKLTLAPLEATLTLFLDEKVACQEVPILAMLLRTHEQISEQANRIAAAIDSQTDHADAVIVDGFSQMGSGSLPGQDLPTTLVAVTPNATSAEQIGRRLGQGATPVFTRIQKGQVLIDPRTLLPDDEEPLVRAFAEALKPEG
jgi:L-seryl-tRNA(Ser) seleniumtransferase